MEHISILIAFGAGVLSFFAPCILPLIPAYICFITGLSFDELRESGGGINFASSTKKILWPTILFILGFSVVFVALGATAGLLGRVVSSYERIIRVFGGCVIILLGLHVSGFFKIKKLYYEKKLHLPYKSASMLGAFIVGVVFSLGWTPCVSPALAAILGLAGAQKTLERGIMLLSAYSIGLGLPFILTALAMNTFLNLFSKIAKYLKVISMISGLLLVVVGILIIIGWPHTI